VGIDPWNSCTSRARGTPAGTAIVTTVATPLLSVSARVPPGVLSMATGTS
jgi:hypothetical protein